MISLDMRELIKTTARLLALALYISGRNLHYQARLPKYGFGIARHAWLLGIFDIDRPNISFALAFELFNIEIGEAQ